MQRLTPETIELTGLATRLAMQTGLTRGLLLRVEAGPDEGRQVSLGAAAAKLGAGGDCALVLSDPAVSRTHAEVLPSKGGVLVRDLQSTNGTYVGGARVQEALVPVGGELTVGSSRIRVVDGGGPQVPPSKPISELV